MMKKIFLFLALILVSALAASADVSYSVTKGACTSTFNPAAVANNYSNTINVAVEGTPDATTTLTVTRTDKAGASTVVGTINVTGSGNYSITDAFTASTAADIYTAEAGGDKKGPYTYKVTNGSTAVGSVSVNVYGGTVAAERIGFTSLDADANHAVTPTCKVTCNATGDATGTWTYYKNGEVWETSDLVDDLTGQGAATKITYSAALTVDGNTYGANAATIYPGAVAVSNTQKATVDYFYKDGKDCGDYKSSFDLAYTAQDLSQVETGNLKVIPTPTLVGYRVWRTVANPTDASDNKLVYENLTDPTTPVTGIDNEEFGSENSEVKATYLVRAYYKLVYPVVNGRRVKESASNYYIADYSFTVEFEPLQPVAQNVQTGVKYSSLNDAVAAAEAGQTVIMLADEDVAATVVVGKQITIDLNGKKLYNTADIWDDAKGNWSVISVREGGNLTVTGNGTIDAKANDEYAFDVQNGGVLTIENGTYTGNISAIYAFKGTVNIKGGFYDIKQKSTYNDYRYLLNCLDANYTNGTAKFVVTGGTYQTFDPKNNLAEGANTNFCAAGYTTTYDATNDTWTVVTAVASVTDAKGVTTYYTTLEEAVAVANAETEAATVTLLADVTVPTMLNITKTMTLDLNGKKINAEGSTASWAMVKDGAVLTINGKTEGSAIYGRLNLGTAENNNGSVVINGGTYSCGSGQTVLHINGTCLASNVTIDGATITSADDNGIQLNGKGEFKISNSTITGATGIYIKSGNLTLTNSTVTGNKASADYSYNGNGANPTGDGIVVDACEYPGGNPTISITECKVTGSKNDVGYYRYDADGDGTKGSATVYSDDDTYSVTTGYAWGPTSTEGIYQLVEAVAQVIATDGTTVVGQYGTLQDAIDAATEDGQTIQLLANIDAGEGYFDIYDAAVTLDLNGHNISSSHPMATILTEVDVKITDSSETPGTISSSAAATLISYAGTLTIEKVNVTSNNLYPVYNYQSTSNTVINSGTLTGAIGVLNNGTLTINGGTVTGTSYYGVQNDLGTLNVTGGTITGPTAAIGDGLTGKGKTVVNISGGTISSETGYALSGNGSYKNSPEWNITGGTLTAGSEHVAIYHPQNGTVNISGGTITGGTAVQMCAGTLNVTGGTITGNGTDSRASLSANDGAIVDGAAISIVNRNYPGGTPSATISNGKISSVLAYNWSGTAASTWEKASDYVTITRTDDAAPIFTIAPEEPYVAEPYQVIPNTDSETKVQYPYTIGIPVMTLAQLSTAGEKGKFYNVVGTKMQAIKSFKYNGDTYLVVKDEDPSTHEYSVNGSDAKVYGIKNATKTSYDQNNWMLVNIGQDEPTQYMGYYLTITGTLTDDVNEMMTKTEITKGAVASSYALNWYTAANFLSSVEKPYQNTNSTQTLSDGEYYFMTPKRCELEEISHAVYEKSSDCFFLATPGTSVNNLGFRGGFKVNWSYNEGGKPEELPDGAICTFLGISKLENAPISAPRRKASASTTSTATPYTESGTGEYTVYPFEFTLDNIDEIGLDLIAVYEGNSTRLTGYTTEDWAGIQAEYPNAVAFVSEGLADWAKTQTNVIVEYKTGYDGDNIYYECPNFVLSEPTELSSACDFYTPVNFTAVDGSYTRAFSADNSTCCVPFELSSAYLGSSAKLLTFAYYQFNGDYSCEIYFNTNTSIVGGTPCFIYDPDRKGIHAEFDNTEIFATIDNSGNLKGTYAYTNSFSENGYYGMADSGNALVLAKNYTVPFRSALALSYDERFNRGSSAAPAMKIVILDGNSTGINDVNTNANAPKGIYTITGINLNEITEPGIYIVDGQKVVVK